MAVNLNLVTFSGGTVIPKTDGIIYDSAIGQCGVFYGCNVTANGNTVYVSSGYGMIRGRFFEMQDSSVDVTLASSDTINGRIYLRLDLSNTTDPLQLLVASGSTLPDLTQEEDANFTNGVWEMELATFEISTSSVDNVVETYETITDNGSLISALQNAVDTLNSNTVLIDSTNQTYNVKVYAYKVGNVVTVTLFRENGAKPASSGWTVIDTLPVGARPKGILVSYFVSGGLTKDIVLRMRIGIGGNIELYGIPQDAQLGGTITFAAATS